MRMRRIKCGRWILWSVVILCLCCPLGYADTLSWISETWRGGTPDEKIGQSIITYDFLTGETETEDISADWLPIPATDAGAGFIFAEYDEETGNIRFFRWTDGEEAPLLPKTYAADSESFLYDNETGTLYMPSADFWKRMCALHGWDIDLESISYDGETHMLHADFSGEDWEHICAILDGTDWLSHILYEGQFVYDERSSDQADIRISTEEISRQMQNDGPYTYRSDYPACIGLKTDTQQLFTWVNLGKEHLETVALYGYDYDSGEFEVYQHPLHLVKHLVCLDPENGQYAAWRTIEGEPITLTDMEMLSERMVYLPERNSFVFLAYDKNPVSDADEMPYSIEGRTMLMEVSLDTGETTILHAYGYEKPDYEEAWVYVQKMHGTRYEDGSVYTPLSEAENEAFLTAISPQPLQDGADPVRIPYTLPLSYHTEQN